MPRMKKAKADAQAKQSAYTYSYLCDIYKEFHMVFVIER